MVPKKAFLDIFLGLAEFSQLAAQIPGRTSETCFPSVTFLKFFNCTQNVSWIFERQSSVSYLWPEEKRFSSSWKRLLLALLAKGFSL